MPSAKWWRLISCWQLANWPNASVTSLAVNINHTWLFPKRFPDYALGIFARLAASITTIEMLVAYFMVHFPELVFPIERGGGEVPLLFIAAFLVILIYGSGKWGLERLITRREIF